MEYQKIANLIDDASNQPSKCRRKNWVEINDESRGTYNANSQIKFKTTILKSSLCDYSDAYILVKGTIAVNNTAAADADANNTNKSGIELTFLLSALACLSVSVKARSTSLLAVLISRSCINCSGLSMVYPLLFRILYPHITLSLLLITLTIFRRFHFDFGLDCCHLQSMRCFQCLVTLVQSLLMFDVSPVML